MIPQSVPHLLQERLAVESAIESRVFNVDFDNASAIIFVFPGIYLSSYSTSFNSSNVLATRALARDILFK